MTKKRLSRRAQLILKTFIPGILFILLGVLVVVFSNFSDNEPYRPGEDMQEITRDLDRVVPEGFTAVEFREVSRKAGIEFTHFRGKRSSQLPEDMGSGLAWGDYDGDGDPDLYLVNVAGPLTTRDTWSESTASNKLYRNEGNGRFTDVTETAGVGARVLGMAAAWADYDSDRDLDLLVTCYGSILLFQNRGDGTFENVAGKAGVARQGYWAGASWGDFDRDGDLDIYVCGYVTYSFDSSNPKKNSSQYASVIPVSLNPSTYPPHANVLFENRGDGTFGDITEHAGVVNEKGRSLGVAWCDFDEDGWPDLYVANDISDNVMYRNLGDGTFADISHAAWVADYRGAMGIAIGDWDGDLDLDIFVSHWIAQENALYVNLLRESAGLDRSKQQSPVNFKDDADFLGLGQVALDYIGWGAFFLDFDNDGNLDLFVTNGSTFQKEEDKQYLIPMKPQLFWNKGSGDGFFEIAELSGEYFKKEWVGRGAAPADYDGDGDLDIAVNHIGASVALLQNQGIPGNHWIAVRLRGAGKNTFGVGARVTVKAGDASRAAVVGSTPSYLSQPDLTLHFGLGKNSEIETIEVLWPSGKTGVVKSPPIDRVLTIAEVP